MAKKYKTKIFLLLLFIYGINSAESDPVNCKEVQCPPPEIIENCPADSILTDKFDLINTLLTTITTTPTTITTTLIPSTTTTTAKTTIPDIISVKSVNEIIYNDNNSNETESIEITANSITSQYSNSTKLNEPITDETIINNTKNIDNMTKVTPAFQQSTISSIDIDTDALSSSMNSSEIPTIDNNKTKKPRKYRKRGRKFYKLTTEQTNEPSITDETEKSESSSQHMLEKRSLRSYQRESIKIVPGGYISYEPKYNHRIWKRNTLSEQLLLSTKLPTNYQRQMCCPKKECTCRENGCVRPMCVKQDHILVEIKNGSNIPGQCCPQYECIEQEPECNEGTIDKPYWLSKCEKCHCIHGTKFCYDGCPPPVKPRNCYSNALKQSFPHGRKWKEDDCATCECVDGRMDCLTTFCKNPNCKKEIKIPGQCCRVCEEQILTTILLITTTTEHTTLLQDYIPENNTNNVTATTTIPSITTSKSEINSSDSIFSVISENIVMVIIITIAIVVVVAGIIVFIYRKCKQRVYEPVKKSESMNSSQTQEKPNGLKATNSQ